jgi:alpha-galactosidase
VLSTQLSRRIPTLLAASGVVVAVLGLGASAGLFPSWATAPTGVTRVGAQSFDGQLPRNSGVPYGNGLAPTPPMGWNGFNRYNRNVTADIVHAEAQALVSSGMKDAGYDYVNLDGGWDLLNRGTAGELIPDPKKFPQGIAPLADFVHSLGLKFGIYIGAGYRNCAGTSAGSYGHYQQDASTFASWGVDYLKLDWCYLPLAQYPRMSHEQLGTMLAQTMGQALLATGRPIVLDVNAFGGDRPWIWARTLGNLWRTTPDIEDNYASLVLNFMRDMSHYQFAGRDHWNDPDMLEVGNGGMTDMEYRTQFTLWSELAAPLIAGNDLTHMSAETLSILTNRDVIAVDQDPLGSQGYPVTNAKGLWVLSRPLASGDRAVVLFNQGNLPAVISTSVGAIGLAGASTYTLHDLWTGEVHSTPQEIQAVVPAHGVVMYMVSPSGVEG